MSDPEKATFFERVRQGLLDSIAYSRGQLNLRTTTLPAPPPNAKAGQIVRLRKRLGMSQAVFAAALSVSYKTVQSWEQGIRQPAAVALRMIQLIRQDPRIIGMVMPMKAVSRCGRAKRSPARVREPMKRAG